MRRALGEVDQNTPIAQRRSPRQCVAHVRDETPVRTRDAADDEGGTPTSARRRNAAALDAAEALVRENRLEVPSRYAKNYLTYAEALQQTGYVGANGVVVLSKRMGAARLQGEMEVSDDAAADALVGMSQTPGNEQEINEERRNESQVEPSAPSTGRKGNSGRRATTAEERERAELARRSVYGYTTYGEYATAVLEVVREIRETTVGEKTALARDLVESRFSCLGEPALTAKYLVALASDEEFSDLRRRGGPIFSFREEESLADRVRGKRQHFLAIRPREVTRWANVMLQKDPERWAKTNGEGLTTGWYPGFARRNGFKMVSKKDLDVVRARWLTAENVSKFYDVLSAAVVALGAAEALPDVTLDREGASQLKIFHPQLWVSMDATCVSLSPEATHSNGQAVISAHAGDEGQTLLSKGLPRNTLVYARNGAGQVLPSMVVCGGRVKLPDDFQRVDLLARSSRQSEDEADADVPPNVVDDAGVPLKTHWTANKTASLNTELLIEWAETCLFPSLRVGGLSAERPAIVLYDGVQTHVSLALIEKCLEQNVYLFLRTPHTTALLQGEDTVVFPYVSFQFSTNLLTLDCRVLKPHVNACVDELTALRNADVDDNGVLRELVWTDISEVLRMTFERIDALKLNRDAWAADGVIPFDRRVAVQLAVDEAEQAEAAAERLIRAVSIDHSTHQRGVNENALSTRHILPRFSQKTQKSLRSAVDGLDEVTALAERFDALLKEGKFSDHTERQFVEQVIASYTRSRDSIEEWLESNPRVPRASDLWDLPGGLCGAAALRLLRTVRAPAQPRPQPQRNGRRGARGPFGGNLDDVRDAGEAIVGDLLNKPPGERDYRALTKANLEKMYVFVTGEWYPAQMSHAWLVDALDPLIAQQYPELSPPDASESESQSGSPMSQVGVVTEGGSFSVDDVENSTQANADVSMNDRSMDDTIA